MQTPSRMAQATRTKINDIMINYYIIYSIISGDKQKIISEREKYTYIYYDKSGYGSKQVTLADERKKDKSITMNDVNEFF